MNRLSVLLKGVLLLVTVVCFAASITIAQDLAKVGAANTKVVLDNDQVRILEVQAKAGEKLPMHSHQGNIVYSFVNGKSKTTFPDGKTKDTEFKAGEARWSDAVTHANEAVTDVHVLVIELKCPRR